MDREIRSKAIDITLEVEGSRRGFPRFIDGRQQKLQGTYTDPTDPLSVLTIARSDELNTIRLINLPITTHDGRVIKSCHYFQYDKQTQRISYYKILAEETRDGAKISSITGDFPSAEVAKLFKLNSDRVNQLQKISPDIDDRYFPKTIPEAELYVERIAAYSPSTDDMRAFLTSFKESFIQSLGGATALNESNRKNKENIDGVEWIVGIDRNDNAFISAFLGNRGNKTEIALKISGGNVGFFIDKSPTPVTHEEIRELSKRKYGVDINFNSMARASEALKPKPPAYTAHAERASMAPRAPELPPQYTTSAIDHFAASVAPGELPPPYTATPTAGHSATPVVSRDPRSL